MGRHLRRWPRALSLPPSNPSEWVLTRGNAMALMGQCSGRGGCVDLGVPHRSRLNCDNDRHVEVLGLGGGRTARNVRDVTILILRDSDRIVMTATVLLV